MGRASGLARRNRLTVTVPRRPVAYVNDGGMTRKLLYADCIQCSVQDL
jgi:hypothetical protein